MSRVARRWLDTQAGLGGDFSAEFTGTARLSALNTGARFNPANSTPLTVACFVYPTQLTSGVYYPYVRVEGGSGGADGWYLQRAGATDQFEAGYSNGTNYYNVDTTSPSINTWYMLMGTWHNTGGSPTIELRVYGPSGALADATNTGTGFVNAAATGNLNMGQRSDAGQSGEVHIDKVGIWGAALSGAQADTLWNGGEGLTGAQLAGAGLTTNLLYWWELDEMAGTPTWPGFYGGVSLTQTGTVGQAARAGH